jgi:hypothetical protein
MPERLRGVLVCAVSGTSQTTHVIRLDPDFGFCNTPGDFSARRSLLWVA